jgi:tetratricopeptide (TPR) repeat protein
LTPERWQRLRRAIDGALAAETPADQEVAVEDACAGDLSLLADARSILRAARHTRGFLEAPPITADSLVPAGFEDRPALIGLTLGHYRIEEHLGAGGMGEVFRAHDLALGREAAVKVLPRRVRPELRRRLVLEAEAASRLQHPGIATFFEAGDDKGETYIAMEFVRGETLRSRLRRGALAVEESLAVAGCLLGALAHAHAAGLLHRDIKPENVMLIGPRSAKLLDFGLACAPAGAGTPAAGEAEPGEQSAFLGTVGYMSPEQVTGEPLDARSDLFQVGVVLYESLTGHPAFRGSDPYERLAATVACAVDLSPLHGGGLPDGLRLIVERALARERDRRYADAMAFLRDLAALAAGGAAGAARSRSDEVVARAESLITLFRREMLEEAIHLLQGAVSLDPDHAPVHAALAHAHDMHAIATTDPAELAEAIRHADRAIALRPDYSEGHLWKGYALWRQGKWPEAAPTLRRAVELAPHDPMASYFLGVASFLEGEAREALPYLARSVELEPRYGMGWLALGADHLMLMNVADAEDAFTRCLALEGNPSTLFKTACAASFLAEALRIGGRLDEARRRVAEGIEAAESSDHPYRDTFRAYGLCVLGRTALQQGDMNGARAAYGQVIAQLRGRTRPRSCGHLMVQALAGLGRAGDQAAFHEAIHLFEARHTWNFENFNGCLPGLDLLELARAAHALGCEAEANALLARACDAGAREPLLPRPG